MAEEAEYPHEHKSEVNSGIESEDRGLFGMSGKKEESKSENEVISQTEPKVEEENKHETLLEKFQQSDNMSSEPKVEEENEHETLQQKFQRSDNIASSNNEELGEKGKENMVEPAIEPEEKLGMLDKIKNKLSGHNKGDEVDPISSPTPAIEDSTVDGEVKEKKGILEKIKDKIHHSKDGEEKKGDENVGISN